MDAAYALKLEQAARALDEAFPKMLFDPLTNDFGDMYFIIDPEDYGQEAVTVDPRFTRFNILRIRGSTKRIDKYLEWTALYEDYIDYLIGKYGSMDMVYDLEENGLLKDPLPSIDHPPILRKGRIRKLFKKGIIPSFMPYGVDPNDCFRHMREICETVICDDPEEPDIDYALNAGLSKEEKETIARNTEKYRRQHRREILISGSSINGISSNMDFIDNYYANVERGTYDTTFSDRDKMGTSIAAQMAQIESEKYRHLGQIWAAEDDASSGKFYDGSYIRDRKKERDFTILQHLQTYAGVDILGSMAQKGISSKAIKAVRAGMVSIGASVGLSEKEKKKLKKKQRKLDRVQNQSIAADRRLSEVLLNNKIFMNGGTVRFEDMRRVRDDDY